MSGEKKSRLVGINHVALEVGDIEKALEFYRQIFEFELRSRQEGMAFIDMGDQFIALAESEEEAAADNHRHFGLVVDDREPLRGRLEELGVEIIESPGLDFLDPWGNRFQVVEYKDIQFTKEEEILTGMNLEELQKTEDARSQLREKGLLR